MLNSEIESLKNSIDSDTSDNTKNENATNRYLEDGQLFYCESVKYNEEENTITFAGTICEPYTLTSAEVKEMATQDVITLEKHTFHESKDNKYIMKPTDESETSAGYKYELLAADTSEHICYIVGNDENGYHLDIGTEFSTIWKHTDQIKEFTFSAAEAFYLDMESLEYANYLEHTELLDTINGMWKSGKENKFDYLVGSYLKFSTCIYDNRSGVTQGH